MDDPPHEQPEIGHKCQRPSARHSGNTNRRRTEQRKLRRRIVSVSDGIDGSDHRVVVLIQHRRSPPQQVSAQLLRLQIPNLPHNAPHAILRRLQLRGHQFPRDRATSAHPLPEAVLQDPRSQRHFLFLRRLREYLSALPARLVQPGDRRHDAVFHRHFRISDHLQEGIGGGLSGTFACGVGNRARQQQRASVPSVWVLGLRRFDCRTSFEIGGSGAVADLRG